MDLNHKKIVMTGATGFVGSNLLRYLCNHYSAECHILIRETSSFWRIKDVRDKVHPVRISLLDQDKLRRTIKRIKPDIVFHLLAYGGFPFQKDIIEVIRSDILATCNLLEACRGLPLEAFINTGSSSEYGPRDSVMAETDPLQPVTYYGAAKSCSTLLSRAYFFQARLPIVNLRLFSPFGFYDDASRLIPHVILSLLQDKPLTIRYPRAVRDYVFINDVVSAYIKALSLKKKQGQVFNIGSGKQVPVRDVVRLIRDILPVYSGTITERKVRSVPLSESPVWRASLARSRNELKWEPGIGLKEGLQKTVEWFSENLEQYKKQG
ncbi:MAG: NAD-dependent epimerase/dehydratase family protein [bacterium]|nr:NAD-dependent epimerase/dehydratase family protein [bacterium]